VALVLEAIEVGSRSTAIARKHLPHFSGSRFRTQLQRLVHLVEATLGVTIKNLREKR
jgi:hypothetical protein